MFYSKLTFVSIYFFDLFLGDSLLEGEVLFLPKENQIQFPFSSCFEKWMQYFQLR